VHIQIITDVITTDVMLAIDTLAEFSGLAKDGVGLLNIATQKANLRRVMSFNGTRRCDACHDQLRHLLKWLITQRVTRRTNAAYVCKLTLSRIVNWLYVKLSCIYKRSVKVTDNIETCRHGEDTDTVDTHYRVERRMLRTKIAR